MLRPSAYLNTRGWTFPIEAKIDLELPPKYVRLAPIFQELRKKGASINSIAAAHNLTWQYVRDVLKFAETGTRPDWEKSRRQRDRRGKRNGGEAPTRPKPKYIEHANLVARLHDEEKMNCRAIQQHLNEELNIEISFETVVRAYDFARRDVVQGAVEQGRQVDRGRNLGLGDEMHRRIRELIESNPRLTNKQIAEQMGCSTSTVHRERQRLRKSNGGTDPR